MDGITLHERLEERIRTVLLKGGPTKRWRVQARVSDRAWNADDFAMVFTDLLTRGVVSIAEDGIVSLLDQRPPRVIPRVALRAARRAVARSFVFCPHCGERLRQ